MEVLDLLNSELILPAIAVLVIAIYIITRIRNNRKYRR